MSDVGIDMDEMDDDSSNVLKELRKAYKAKEKQVKELEEQLNQIQGAARQTTVEGVLTEAGINSRVAKFIPDSVTTSDEVHEWLTENGELFGVSVTKVEAESSDAVKAAARIASVADAGGPVDPGDMASRLAGANTEAELNLILFGNETGPVG